VGLKLNGTYQLLVNADDVKLLEDNRDIIKKTTDTLTDASKEVGLEVNTKKTSKEVGLEVNTKKTKYMFLSHHQNAGQNHGIKVANRGFEKVHSSDILERP
jgi:hypothetical protein